MESVDTKTASSGNPKPLNYILVVGGLLALLTGLACWAMSSPTGASPDEDYHLGSIWCPRPIESSGCSYETENDQIVSVDVPQSVANPMSCYIRHTQQNAACADALSDSAFQPTDRFDNGTYPLGFYHVNHLFVGPDVDRSVTSMKVFNALLGLGGLALASILAPPKLRHSAVVAATVAWVPMGVYFISSVNPSSWSISGCLIYAVALIGAVESTGKRRWALLAVAGYGALLAIESRTDARIYVLVISLAIWVFVRITRKRLLLLTASALASIPGLLVFLPTEGGSQFTGSGGWPMSEWPLPKIFAYNIMSLPEYLGSLWGLRWGPGWFDVPLLGWSTLTMIAVAGGVVFVGIQELYWRKALAVVLISGALCGIPVVSLTLRHVQPVIFYQGRYLLPLLAVVLLLCLARQGARSFFLARGQLALIVVISGVANALALRRIIARYASGVLTEDYSFAVFNPQWWPWPISIDAFWAVGSLTMAIGLCCLLIASARSVKLLQSDGDRAMTPKRAARAD
ncbi:DUF2142 domain-containing protein [Propionimicrobium sp. PCR01-08-3]|uniref:DUF2142 domain-containing protein n=1 Tax=Propionimicrobium sp. PCR01-08-3 TaxID=3052086 RepID=UPI00255C9905|nr:DUF2142 domain-containing protein [Propionimicrobium sp. PCR01-08-3]WIY82637.1 DUF2142 domain-containing protein [Propionimicrobium sp. PCR01-08-3]